MDAFACTEGFEKKVLILHGTEDTLVPISYSEEAARRYRSASLVPFEGEKHGFTAKGNARVAELALQFLTELV